MIHADSKDIGPAADLAETVYLAGSAFITLGVGNSIVSGPARFLVVLAGLSGLASVTIGATFLLPVQQALHRREVLVLSTLSVAGLILETYGLNEAPDALAELFRDWEKWAADVLHSHRADPVLAHFRSTDEDGEWLAVFGAVLDVAALLLERPRPRDLLRLPRACSFRSAAALSALLRDFSPYMRRPRVTRRSIENNSRSCASGSAAQATACASRKTRRTSDFSNCARTTGRT
jgi:hypothetical protein